MTSDASDAVWGGTATDLVTILEHTAEGGVLHWEAYWRDLPADGEDFGPATCLPENLAFSTEDEPVNVVDGQALSAPSPALKPEWPAKLQDVPLDWVAVYSATDREGESAELLRGECGEVGETTLIKPFSITTKAKDATIKDDVWDTATITDVPAEGHVEITVVPYLRPEGSAVAVCTEETRVTTFTGAPVQVTKDGDYDLPKLSTDGLAVDDKIDWVETGTHYDAEGNKVLTRTGECGAANETSTVLAAVKLAVTGAPAFALPLFGGLAVSLLGAGVALLVLKRRRRPVADAPAAVVDERE